MDSDNALVFSLRDRATMAHLDVQIAKREQREREREHLVEVWRLVVRSVLEIDDPPEPKLGASGERDVILGDIEGLTFRVNYPVNGRVLEVDIDRFYLEVLVNKSTSFGSDTWMTVRSLADLGRIIADKQI